MKKKKRVHTSPSRRHLVRTLQPVTRRSPRQAAILTGVVALSIVAVVVIFASLHASLAASAPPPASTPTPDQSLTTLLSSPTSTVGSQVRTGIFSLAQTGPLPVPANVFSPVNSARIVLNNDVYSIYAGWMTRQPGVGALVVLKTNAVSGQQSLHTYQTPRAIGALTILSVQQNIVTFTAAHGHGSFDLLTDQFHW